jgi:outer membrane protein TolC
MTTLRLIVVAALATGALAAGAAEQRAYTHAAAPAPTEAAPSSLATLIDEALRANPEIRAARQEAEAAQHRIAPAGALNDPMLEAGVLNLPVDTFSFRQDDMTMKMIGLGQRLPYPGKRRLREEVAEQDAEASRHGSQDTVNRVVRNVKVAYYSLALSASATHLTRRNRDALEQLFRIAQAKYEVGQGNQADVFKAQLQLSRMSDALIRLARQQREAEGELEAALGRPPGVTRIAPEPLRPAGAEAPVEVFQEQALAAQPRLLGLQSKITRSQKTLDLAAREYYPDFDLKFAYGQRDRAEDGRYRPDMVLFTVGINLPVWRSTKLAPMVAEAEAMRGQALDQYEAQRNELLMELHHQAAAAEQNLASARLYESTIVPQAKLAVESSLAAYRVNRLDFLNVVDSQMTVFNAELAYAEAIAGYNKALAEIDLLTGRPPDAGVAPVELRHEEGRK